jgi:hypothetical protein
MYCRTILLITCLLLLTSSAFAQVGSITGTVLLPRDAGPAVGATVLLGGMNHRGDSLAAETDENGNFTFEEVPVGEWHVWAMLDGYLPAHGVVAVLEGQAAELVLTLGRLPTGYGRVEGTIFLPNDGGPAVGATVVLYRARGDSLVTETDENGHYALDSARTGRHDFNASLEGYRKTYTRINVIDDETIQVDLTLRVPLTGYGRVEGTILLPNDEGPAAGATVVLYRARGDSLMTETDENGLFAFDSARTGTHNINARLEGYRTVYGRVRVPDAQTIEVTMTLRVPLTGYGRVVCLVSLPLERGEAVGATVVLFRARGDSLVAQTDENGLCAFDSARTGTHDIYAMLEGYRPTHRKIRVIDAETVGINMTLRHIPTGYGRIIGVALLPDRQTPAPDARVILYRGVGDSIMTITDEEGHFAFDSARVGLHDIIVRKAGYWAGYNHVRVLDAQMVQCVMTLRAVPDGVGGVEGVVFLPDRGGVAAGATVVLFRARGDSLVTVADDSGHFAFENGRIGRHDMMAYLEGYSRAHAVVRLLENQVVQVHLVLRPEGRDGGAQDAPGDANVLPFDHLMAENYPNPFNPTTTLRFAIPEASNVQLTVYDLAGHTVATLARGYYLPGAYSVVFSGAGLPTGIYIYRLQAGAERVTGRLVLQK